MKLNEEHEDSLRIFKKFSQNFFKTINQPKTFLKTLKPAKQQSNRTEDQNSQQKSKIRIKHTRISKISKTLIFRFQKFRKFHSLFLQQTILNRAIKSLML
ncbi:hypothetical protein HanIR_Chr12g0590061 [Helianthus annuus]|nr:hypothetical protein HanIR_Chr12g0590061 [Helianthus annuus]